FGPNQRISSCAVANRDCSSRQEMRVDFEPSNETERTEIPARPAVWGTARRVGCCAWLFVANCDKLLITSLPLPQGLWCRCRWVRGPPLGGRRSLSLLRRKLTCPPPARDSQ